MLQVGDNVTIWTNERNHRIPSLFSSQNVVTSCFGEIYEKHFHTKLLIFTLIRKSSTLILPNLIAYEHQS